jgi:hypothetical protein
MMFTEARSATSKGLGVRVPLTPPNSTYVLIIALLSRYLFVRVAVLMTKSLSLCSRSGINVSIASCYARTSAVSPSPSMRRRTMNDIDEFLKVALALFLSISGLLLLLTYLERSLSEPAKESARQVTTRLGARGAVYQWLLRRRRKSK